MEFPTLINWTYSFRIKGYGVVSFNFIQFLKAYSARKQSKPDQTPRSAASDLVLHLFQMSHKKDAGLTWVKNENADPIDVL